MNDCPRQNPAYRPAPPYFNVQLSTFSFSPVAECSVASPWIEKRMQSAPDTPPRGLRHESVLLDGAVDALVHDPAGAYLDGTFGRGGHSRAILARLSAEGRLLAIDRDPQAIAEAAAIEDPRFTIERAEFARLATVAEAHGLHGRLAGVLLDIGVSSPQLDDPERGFSFLRDGPLDMRICLLYTSPSPRD